VSILDTGALPSGILPARTARERRAHRRKPTLWEGRLDTDAGVFPCVVLNVSQGGAMVQIDAPLVPSARTTLMIERLGSLGAQIVWQIVEDGRIGLRFTDPPQQVARILSSALPL
jgi:hypothetical protein